METAKFISFVILFAFVNPLFAVTLTSHTVIDSDDYSYDEQDIVVDGSIVPGCILMISEALMGTLGMVEPKNE